MKSGVQSRKKFLERNHNLIVYLYPGVHKVYGPYLSKDKRYRVVLHYTDKSKKTRQFSKLKMEIKLERRIEEPETVDHKDDNFRNDRYSNLQVLNRRDHIKLDVIRKRHLIVNCVWCKKRFAYKSNRSPLVAGPFCSRKCTGKYGALISQGGSRLKPKGRVKREYYTRKTAIYSAPLAKMVRRGGLKSP